MGNTPAICRKCYIHPAVLEGYLNGSLRRTLAAVGKEEGPPEMWRVERIVMRFLAEQQKTDGRSTGAAGLVESCVRLNHRKSSPKSSFAVK